MNQHIEEAIKEVIESVKAILRDSGYGEVTIVIHQGTGIQVHTLIKKRIS